MLKLPFFSFTVHLRHYIMYNNVHELIILSYLRVDPLTMVISGRTHMHMYVHPKEIHTNKRVCVCMCLYIYIFFSIFKYFMSMIIYFIKFQQTLTCHLEMLFLLSFLICSEHLSDCYVSVGFQFLYDVFCI